MFITFNRTFKTLKCFIESTFFMYKTSINTKNFAPAFEFCGFNWFLFFVILDIIICHWCRLRYDSMNLLCIDPCELDSVASLTWGEWILHVEDVDRYCQVSENDNCRCMTCTKFKQFELKSQGYFDSKWVKCQEVFCKDFIMQTQMENLRHLS